MGAVPWSVRDFFVSVGITFVFTNLLSAHEHWNSPSPRAWEQSALPCAKPACFLKTCPQCGITGGESSDWNCSAVVLHICAAMFVTLPSLWIVLCRCGGTVGAIFTCPLEVIKTRLQSSKLAFRTVYYPQVQLGTISGEGMVRPTSVSPGLFSVLKWVLLLLSFTIPWHTDPSFTSLK